MSLYHHATNEMKYEAEKRRASDRVKRARKILDVLETFIPESELTPLGVQRHSPWLHSLDPPPILLTQLLSSSRNLLWDCRLSCESLFRAKLNNRLLGSQQNMMHYHPATPMF